MPHASPEGVGRRAALAVYRRLMGAGELRAWPYCEASECSRPAMEVVELCLASDGTRLLRPLYLCSVHADVLPLPLFRRAPLAEMG